MNASPYRGEPAERRSVVFSPDGKTMYVAVGSSGNVAADIGPARGIVTEWLKPLPARAGMIRLMVSILIVPTH